MRNHICFILGVSAALLVGIGLAGCHPIQKSSSKLTEAPNPSDIWLSAANPAAVGQGAFDLLVSTPATYDTVTICEDINAANCGAASRPFKQATKLPVNQARSFFLISEFVISEGMDIAVRATGANGDSAQRSIKVAQPGQDPFGQEQAQTTAEATNGSGGALGQIVDRNQYTYQGMSSQYRFWAPAVSANKAVPLIVYLHGDTGSNYGPPALNPDRIVESSPEWGTLWYFGNQTKPTLNMAREEAATEPLWEEVMFVSILAPHSRGADGMTTWASFEANNRERKRRESAAYVHNLIQGEIFPKFNIDKRSVFFIGQSGGAVFLTTSLIPLYGNQYRGGGISLCGGQPPMCEFAPSEKFKKSFKLHFQTTGDELRNAVPGYNEDFYTIIPLAQQRYQALIGNEAAVSLTDEGNGKHCFFEANGQKVSQPTLVAPIIKRMQRENGVL